MGRGQRCGDIESVVVRVMGLILLIVLIVLLIGTAPAWPYSRGWGYAPSGGIGTILLVLLILWLLGVIH